MPFAIVMHGVPSKEAGQPVRPPKPPKLKKWLRALLIEGFERSTGLGGPDAIKLWKLRSPRRPKLEIQSAAEAGRAQTWRPA